MALLRPCGRLIRSLSVLRVKCQLLSVPKTQKNPEIRGYVTSNLLQKQRQSSTKREKATKSSSTVNEHSSADNERKSGDLDRSDADLEIYLDLVNFSLREKQVPYDHLVTALRLFSQSLDIKEKNNKKHRNNNKWRKNDEDFDENDEKIDEKFEKIGEKYEKITKNKSNYEKPEIFLLSCCGESLWSLPLVQRQQLTQQVWDLIANRLENLTLEHYHTLLTVCIENRQQIDPELFIKQMTVPAEEQTYILLMKIAGRTGDLDASAFLLAKMKELDFTLHLETLTALLEVYCTKGDVEQALETMNSVFTAGIKPGEEMWSCLAKGYAVKGDLSNISTLITKFDFKTRDLCEIIDILSNSNTTDQIIDFLIKLSPEKLENIGEDTIFIASMINLVKCKKINESSKIIDFFIKNKQKTDDKLTTLIIYYLKTLVSTKAAEKTIFDEFNSFKKSEKFDEKSVNTFLISLLEEILKSNRKELVFNILREFVSHKIDIRVHYFWPLLAKSDDEDEIFRIIRQMRRFHVRIDTETLVLFVLPKMNTISPEFALNKLTDGGLTVASALTALSCHLLNVGRPREASKMLTNTSAAVDFREIIESLVKSFKILKNVESATRILEKAGKDFAGRFLIGIMSNDGKVDELTLKDLLESFHNKKITISSQSAEFFVREAEKRRFSTDFGALIQPIVSDKFKMSKGEKFMGIPHPRDMDVDDLEAHLVELRAKKLNFRGVLRKLFMLHCKLGNLERVEGIKAELETMGVQLQPGMKALLFELYVENGKIGEVCRIILDLQTNHPNFQIDGFKILKAAKALVEQGKVDMALEIVRNSGKVRRFANFESFLLLDAVARSERSDILEQTLEILTEGNFCELNSEILGVLMRPGVIRKEWGSVVRMMEEFVELYSVAPLKQEVLSALVEEGEGELVAKVVECVEKVHGKDAAVQHLVIAYGKHGRVAEMKALFETQETSKVPRLYFSKATTAEVKAQVLSNILVASQGIQMDVQNVYEPLLLTYLELGDYEAADSLLKRLRDDPTPSLAFKEKLDKISTSWKAAVPKVKKLYKKK